MFIVCAVNMIYDIDNCSTIVLHNAGYHTRTNTGPPAILNYNFKLDLAFANVKLKNSVKN